MDTTKILQVVGVVCLLLALGAVLNVIAVSALAFAFAGIVCLVLAAVL